MYSDVTCIRGSGKKKNRDFGCAARKSRTDNYYHEEARAKTEREGLEMEARWGRRARKREREKKWQRGKEKESERLDRVARDGQDEAEEKGVGCEHVDLR